MIKERPILFSAPMVRAILAGQKTQTRRVVKPAPVNVVPFIGADNRPTWEYGLCLEYDRVINKHIRCPYGQPGDRLWVRETWTEVPRPQPGLKCRMVGERGITYAADWDGNPSGFRWRASIHMPRWASRITLEVTGVRVERLQSLSTMDAMAEGIPQTGGEAHALGLHDMTTEYGHEWDNRTSIENYMLLWSKINGAESWDANPWVWVVEFKPVMEPNP